MRRILLTIIYYLVFSPTLFGTKPDIEFENFSIEDGLSQSTVRSIYQDRSGFLWFGTHLGGLNRFDGTEFVIYKHNYKDTTSLINNQVNKIFEDKAGDLWLATPDGISKFDREQNSFQNFLNSDLWLKVYKSVDDIYIEDDEKFWLATNGGLFLVIPAKDSIHNFLSHLSIEQQNTNCIFKDIDGNIWIGSDNGLLIYNSQNNRVENIIGRNSEWYNELRYIKHITQDKYKNLWISTLRNGLFCINNGEELVIKNYINNPLDKNSISSNDVRCTTADKKGNLWIGTYSGLNYLDRVTNKIYHYLEDENDPKSLSKNSVYSLFMDSNEEIWIGTWNGGINRIVQKKGRILHQKHKINDYNSLNSNTIACFLPVNKGLWIGTQKGGLNYYDGKTGKYIHYLNNPSDNNSISSNHIFFIAPENNSALWIGTNKGLNYFNTQKKRFKHFFNERRVLKVLNENKSLLWVVFENEIVLINKDSGEIVDTVISATKRHLYGYNLELFTRLQSGKVILLSNSNLFEYDSISRKFFGTANSSANFSNNLKRIYCIHEDKKEVLWVGSETGLHRFNLKQNTIESLKHFNEPVPVDVKGILDDAAGNLWLSSTNGLYRFSPTTGETKHFSVKDGLQSNEFIHSSCALNQKGEMFFGGINGYNLFHPDSLIFDNTQTKTVLVDFLLFNKKVGIGFGNSPLKKDISLTNEITLNYKQNVFTLKYSALSFRKNKNTKYAYKLIGYDSEWNNVGSKQTASYMNLSPGVYQFLVKSTNSDGEWSNNNAVLKINVLPPYWQTRWFRIIIILFSVSSIVLIFWIRLSSITKQKAALEKLVESRTRDLQERNTELKQQKEKVSAKNESLNNKNEEIIRQSEELNKLNQEIQEVNKMKLRFFTNISHEFRTPLTLILGPLEKLLRDTNDKSEGGRLLKIMHKNSKRLLLLINRLMDFRTLQQGRMELKLEPGDFITFVREIKSVFDDLATRQNINFRFDSDTKTLKTKFDHQKMEIVLYNLLSNAFKYTPPNSNITIKLINSTSAKNHFELLVEDTGRGISKADQEYIFERFMQVNSSEVHKYNGSGIGLAYTKELIDLFNGNIRVESELGAGSKFIIQLPLLTTEEDYLSEKISTRQTLSNDNLQGLKNLTRQLIEDHENNDMTPEPQENDSAKPQVLVIDDNQDILTFINSGLSSFYNIIEANNGLDGLNFADELNPDIIISDIVMPKLNGIELCEKIKTNIKISHIPVILLTAYTSDTNQIEGLKIGADDYISKPFNLNILKIKIDNLLNSRKLLKEKFQRSFELESKEISVTSADEVFLQNLIKIIEDHMSEIDFNVDKLSKLAFVSNVHLYRKLQSLTGLKPSNFIRTMRLKRAAYLLRTSDLRIYEVMDHTGFDGRAVFNSNFRKQFGMTPTEYVRSNNSN